MKFITDSDELEKLIDLYDNESRSKIVGDDNPLKRARRAICKFLESKQQVKSTTGLENKFIEYFYYIFRGLSHDLAQMAEKELDQTKLVQTDINNIKLYKELEQKYAVLEEQAKRKYFSSKAVKRLIIEKFGLEDEGYGDLSIKVGSINVLSLEELTESICKLTPQENRYRVEMVDVQTGRIVCLVDGLSEDDAKNKTKEMEHKIDDNPIGDYYARMVMEDVK